MNTDQINAATPPERDRVVDLLRVGSLLVVVFGHWLMATVAVTADGIRPANALSSLPALEPLTWVLQVMPLFFVAGGFANLTVWRRTTERGGGYVDYLAGRLGRLLRPTLVFVLTWQAALVLLRGVGLPPDDLVLVGRLLGQPLWFLGVYVAVTALAPVLADLHVRRPVAILVALGAGAVVVDVARFAGDLPAVGYVNLALVWLFVQQLGFWYADGRLARMPRREWWGVLVAALAGLVALTAYGPYPLSMVGLPGQVSNLAPPTLCLLGLAIGQTAVVMLARPRLNRWLARPRPWAGVVTVGSMAMTVYLWHMSVLMAAYVLLLSLGVDPPRAGTSDWWLSRPVWIGVLAAGLVAATVPLSRFERAYPNRSGPVAGSVWLSAAAAALATLGLLGYVASGLAPAAPWSSTLLVIPVDAVQNTVCLLAGFALSQHGHSRHGEHHHGHPRAHRGVTGRVDRARAAAGLSSVVERQREPRQRDEHEVGRQQR